MFSWFTEWNKRHPVDVYRPAILVGVVGGGVFVATMLVAWGQPFATKSLQTGPRGTGGTVWIDTKYTKPGSTAARRATRTLPVPGPFPGTRRAVPSTVSGIDESRTCRAIRRPGGPMISY